MIRIARHHQERERRRGRVVALDQVEGLDLVADHRLARPAEQRGVDVVAERGDEGEQDAGDDPGRGQRQGDLEEGRARRRVEVAGCLEQAVVELLEARVQGQDHEREEVVGQPGDHGAARGQHAPVIWDGADELEHVDDRAVVAEDRLPGDRADQVGGEERRDHREQEQQAPARADLEGDRVGERIGDQQREQGRGAGVPHRAQDLIAAALERVGEVRPLPGEGEAAARERAGAQRHLAP